MELPHRNRCLEPARAFSWNWAGRRRNQAGPRTIRGLYSDTATTMMSPNDSTLLPCHRVLPAPTQSDCRNCRPNCRRAEVWPEAKAADLFRVNLSHQTELTAIPDWKSLCWEWLKRWADASAGDAVCCGGWDSVGSDREAEAGWDCLRRWHRSLRPDLNELYRRREAEEVCND